MEIGVFTGCAMGLWVGARHALEPDHLAAVSTLVADRPSARSAALLGALWGLGHTAALLAVGVALLALRAELPADAERAAELIVAAMLVWLGVRNLVRAFVATDHAHGDEVHRHPGALDHAHGHRHGASMRPLVIGLVHGLAGSGALTALAVAGMPTTGSAILYMALFGLGSVAGMMMISAVAGATLHRLLRGPRSQSYLTAATGALSVAIGVIWAAAAI